MSRQRDRWGGRKAAEEGRVWTMPHGKYKGCTIRDVPDDYLGWMVRVAHTNASRATGNERRPLTEAKVVPRKGKARRVAGWSR